MKELVINSNCIRKARIALRNIKLTDFFIQGVEILIRDIAGRIYKTITGRKHLLSELVYLLDRNSVNCFAISQYYLFNFAVFPNYAVKIKIE